MTKAYDISELIDFREQSDGSMTVEPKRDGPALTELCPKCGLRMFNWPGRLTKCQSCLHEWYMDSSVQPAGD